MKATHNNLEYVEIAVPEAKARMLYPANTFSVRLTSDHAEITISTDLAGIPAVKEKLDALATFMAVQMQQPEVIERYAVSAAEESSAAPQANAQPSPEQPQ